MKDKIWKDKYQIVITIFLGIIGFPLLLEIIILSLIIFAPNSIGLIYAYINDYFLWTASNRQFILSHYLLFTILIIGFFSIIISLKYKRLHNLKVKVD